MRANLATKSVLLIIGLMFAVPVRGEEPAAVRTKPSRLEIRDLVQIRRSLQGRVVWESNRTGGWQIFSMDLAELKPAQLTHNDADDAHPVWAPDGKAIFFDRRAKGKNAPAIMKMNPDGSGQTVVVENGFHPSLSADGKILVFVRLEDGKSCISLRDIQTGAEREILPKAQPHLAGSSLDQPSISPDAKRLAFYSTFRGRYVRVVNLAGTRAAVIGRGREPDFSPDESSRPPPRCAAPFRSRFV